MRPLLCHGYARFLETYQLLPTVGVLPTPDGQWDDLSLYLLFLGENISELKSFKYIKVWQCNNHAFYGFAFMSELQINSFCRGGGDTDLFIIYLSVLRFYLEPTAKLRTLTFKIFFCFLNFLVLTSPSVAINIHTRLSLTDAALGSTITKHEP